ncbi:hypothetical protein [Stenotrophomonas pavanii]
MTLAWATLVEGTETPAGDGITGALRCVIEIEDGEQVAAVLKRDTPDLVFAEALCGMLLTKWGLRVPAPYLVNEPDRISFASADVGYPNLKKALGLDSQYLSAEEADELTRLAFDVVMSFPTTSLAIALDEAIDNRDRNLGNILWDGSEEAWIDHAFALGNGVAMPDRNILCEIATINGIADQTSQAAIARWASLDRDAVADAAGEIGVLHDCAAWQDLVLQRLDTLGMRILARFPRPHDLLSQTP